jgi:probable F420-dependent oxidoreductase
MSSTSESSASEPSTLDASTIEDWRGRLGRIGVWCATDGMGVEKASAFAAEVEQLGYGALWLPETLGRDPFAHAAHLADRAGDLLLATGIANIHHRHPGAMLQASNTLGEQSGGRFLLGIGVSHQPMVEGLRGLDYGKPLSMMRTYLDGMDASPYMAAPPAAPVPRLLAALGPKMLELAATRADGAHPYFTTPEHTATARSILGPDKLLCVEQKVVLTEDPAAGRETAHAALGMYATLPNYRNNWLRLGYTEEEIESRDPRFVDAVVAWGSVDALQGRVQAHLDAGADHVCIQALSLGSPFKADRDALAALAPAG